MDRCTENVHKLQVAKSVTVICRDVHFWQLDKVLKPSLRTGKDVAGRGSADANWGGALTIELTQFDPVKLGAFTVDMFGKKPPKENGTEP